MCLSISDSESILQNFGLYKVHYLLVYVSICLPHRLVQSAPVLRLIIYIISLLKTFAAVNLICRQRDIGTIFCLSK